MQRNQGDPEALGIEPSVISRQIQQLETELGVVLLERRGRGVIPTEAARFVLELCDERRVGEDTLKMRLSELQGLERGELHIAAGEGFIDDLMTKVLNEFCRCYPRIDVALDSVSASEAVRLVAEDRVHLGLTLCAPLHPSVRVVSERAQPLCVIASARHPLAASTEPLSLRDVREYPIALASPGTGLRTLVQLAEFSEKFQFSPSFTANSIHTIKHFLHANLGVTFLSTFSIAQDLDEGNLIARRTDNAVFENASGQLLVRSGRRFSAPLQQLLSMIQSTQAFH